MAFYLYLMRHAKSDWSGLVSSDFDRPINRRGQRAAGQIGAWMDHHHHRPDSIICSPAVRAQQTAIILTSRFKGFDNARIIYDNALYRAHVNTLIKVINQYQTGINSLMLLAHNPGLEHLTAYLIDLSSECSQKKQAFTTANLVIFRYNNAVFDAAIESCRLRAWIRPKDL